MWAYPHPFHHPVKPRKPSHVCEQHVRESRRSKKGKDASTNTYLLFDMLFLQKAKTFDISHLKKHNIQTMPCFKYRLIRRPEKNKMAFSNRHKIPFPTRGVDVDPRLDLLPTNGYKKRLMTSECGKTIDQMQDLYENKYNTIFMQGFQLWNDTIWEIIWIDDFFNEQKISKINKRIVRVTHYACAQRENVISSDAANFTLTFIEPLLNENHTKTHKRKKILFCIYYVLLMSCIYYFILIKNTCNIYIYI